MIYFTVCRRCEEKLDTAAKVLQSLLHYWGGMATLVCLIAEKLKRYAQNEVDMRLSSVLVFCSTELKSILPAPSSPVPPPLCYTSLAILKLVPSIKRATRRVDSRRPKCKFFLLLLLLSTFFVLIKFHKLYAKHYSVSPHSAEWGGYSVLILRPRLLLVFLMQLSTPSHKSLLGSLPSCALSRSLSLSAPLNCFWLGWLWKHCRVDEMKSSSSEVFWLNRFLPQLPGLDKLRVAASSLWWYICHCVSCIYN